MKPIPRDSGAVKDLAFDVSDLKNHKPIWLVGLSFERETRKFLAGVAERYIG